MDQRPSQKFDALRNGYVQSTSSKNERVVCMLVALGMALIGFVTQKCYVKAYLALYNNIT